MKTLMTLDFETYWANDFTLSKMPTSQYVRGLNPGLIHGAAIKWDGNETGWVPGEELQEFFASLDWGNIITLAHHAHFDNAILSWIYGHRPAFILDTLSMARAYYPGESVSLAKLSERLGLTPKGTELANTKNILPCDMTPEGKRNLALYSLDDVDNTYAIYQQLKVHFPFPELQLIDMTVRQFTEPVLCLNEALLKETYSDEMNRKQEMMEYANSHREQLGSNEQFAALLEALGVEPPMKPSPAAAKRGELVMAYAFAKSDEEFVALKEHDDPRVVALVEARLAIKSTITETRTTRMMALGTPAPFYYLYYGGHTGRWSGGDKLNPQNFTRGSALRESIEAPPGYQLVVRDLSQIEARMLAVVAGQENVVRQFANNEDVYSHMASTIYGRHVDRKAVKEDYIPGFIGKAVVLGCGYGLGWAKFQSMMRVGMLGMKGILFDESMVAALGVDVDAITARNDIAARILETKPYALTLEQHRVHCACAIHIINTFRNNNPKIVQLWAAANNALDYMLGGTYYEFGEGVVVSTAENSILMPNGMYLKYPKLACKQGKGGHKEYSVTKRRGRGFVATKVYGGLVVENCIQALSRNVIAEDMLTMRAEGMHVVMHTHDEIVVMAREDEAERVYIRMGEIMAIAPSWAPALPLASEGGFAQNYSK